MSTFIGKAINEVGSHIVGVNYVKWAIMPGATVTVLLWVLILGLIQPNLTGTDTYNLCDTIRDPSAERTFETHMVKGRKKKRETTPTIKANCRDTEISNGWKLGLVIALPLIMGGLSGLASYKVGLAVYNPKAAAAIVGTSIARNMIF